MAPLVWNMRQMPSVGSGSSDGSASSAFCTRRSSSPLSAKKSRRPPSGSLVSSRPPRCATSASTGASGSMAASAMRQTRCRAASGSLPSSSSRANQTAGHETRPLGGASTGRLQAQVGGQAGERVVGRLRAGNLRQAARVDAGRHGHALGFKERAEALRVVDHDQPAAAELRHLPHHRARMRLAGDGRRVQPGHLQRGGGEVTGIGQRGRTPPPRRRAWPAAPAAASTTPSSSGEGPVVVSARNVSGVSAIGHVSTGRTDYCKAAALCQ